MKKGIIIFLSITLGIAGCNSKSDIEQKREELAKKNKKYHALKKKIDKLHEQIEKLDSSSNVEVLDVYVSKISSSDFSSYVEVQGIVKTDKNVTVIPEANGVIKKIYVRSGQKVKAWQVLAKIDDSILKRNLNEINTSLELAEELYLKQKKTS